MAERLDWTDPYLWEFDARVEALVERDGRTGVVLDRSAFYPEGGGQPADRGVLGRAEVADVEEVAGEVLHYCTGELPGVGERVAAKVDGARRFDHMQQHTGQHLLTRAFLRVLGAATTSFHLGGDAATIDLDRAAPEGGDLLAVEEEAARVLRANAPVAARLFAPGAERPAGLRKTPEVAGDFRVIQIGDYDACACGGTHVRATAEIEAVAVTRVERLGPRASRVEFLCGARARRDHRGKIELARELARLLSADSAALLPAVQRTVERLKVAEKRCREQAAELLPARAARLFAEAASAGPARLVAAVVPVEDKGDLGRLGQELLKTPHVVAVLAAAGEKGQFVCASNEPAVPAGLLLREVLAPFQGQGGGSVHLAQGGFAEPGRAAAVVAAAAAAARARLGLAP